MQYNHIKGVIVTAEFTVVNQCAKIQNHKFLGLPQKTGAANDAAIERAFRASDIIILDWGYSNRFEVRKAFASNQIKHFSNKRIYKTRTHPACGSTKCLFYRQTSIDNLPLTIIH